MIIPFYINFIGCPNQCVFCNQSVINESEKSQQEAFKVFLEDTFKNTYKEPVQLAFYGGSFTNMPRPIMQYYLEALKPYLEDGRIDSIRCSTRPDGIDETILNHLKAYRCRTIELGVQSMNDDVLLKSERGMTKEQIRTASHVIKQRGIQLVHQLMIGLPGDNFKTFKHTIEESIVLKPDAVRLYPTQILTNTQLEQMYVNGLYMPMDLKQAIDFAKYAIKAFKKEGIEILKVGLHANDSMMDSNFRLAGPYHPAFREVVESEMVCDNILKLITHHKLLNTKISIYTHPKWISRVVGYQAKTRKLLKENYNIDLKIVSKGDIDEGAFKLVTDTLCIAFQYYKL